MSAPPKRTGPASRRDLRAALLAAIGLGALIAARRADAFEDPANATKPTNSQNSAEIVDLICLASKRPIVIRLHISVDGQPTSEFRESIARRLFDLLDTDKNGLLAGKELAALPTPQIVAAASREPGTLPDTDAIAPLAPVKGQVTPEAWARFLFSGSGTPLSLASPVGSEPMRNRPYPGMAPVPEGGELGALLGAIDANGDHRLSAAELSRGDELFRLFDLNDDEQISRAELDALLKLASTSKFSQGGSDKPAVPLELIPRTPDKTALVQRLIETFAVEPKPRDQPGGKSNDGKSPRQSRAIPAECIAGADTNGDGKIDERELAAWLAHPQPQCELAVELVSSSLQEPRVKVLAVHSSARDAGLSVETPSPAQVLLRVGSVPLELRAAEASRRVARTSRYRAQFKRADQNQNGYLEKSEIPFLGPGLNAVDFAAMDRDHNGMVFEDEWVAYLRLRDTLAESRLSLTVAAEWANLIAQFDANHDGRLNRTEFGRALAAIAAWDRNHDGFVTPDEVPKTLVGTFHIGTLRAVSARRPRSSRMKEPEQPPSEGPVWFQKMDRDHDGEVSLREFLGPLSVFRRLDTNGDGRLDVHEAQSAQK